MLRTLIEKEIKSVLLSPKFALTFAVASLLILLSIGVGLREYHAFEDRQAAAERLLAEELQEETSWRGLATRALRAPDPMQIFVAGVHNDVGRTARIHPRAEARLDQSTYSEDTLLAIFRSLDLSFIVQAVLSLFAILFTYDAVNGERQSGTLRLIFAGAVPRARFVLAKFLGTWLGLAVPLALPVLLGLLWVVLRQVPLDGDDWGRLGVFLLASALYFTFFVAFGIAVSALTKRPSTSFLTLLVAWVLMVLVIPRAGLLTASQLVPVPTTAEIESRKVGFETRARNDYRRSLETTWRQRRQQMEGLSVEEQDAYEDRNLWQWLEEDDDAVKAMEAEVAEHSARLDEELRLRKAQQEQLAFSLSRVSPASAYRLAAMQLAGTGVELKTRYEDAARNYKQDFVRYVEQTSNTSNYVVRRRGGHAGDWMGAQEALDLSGMPQFRAPSVELREVVADTPMDLGLLMLESLLCFAVGFAGFLRYDVR